MSGRPSAPYMKRFSAAQKAQYSRLRKALLSSVFGWACLAALPATSAACSATSGSGVADSVSAQVRPDSIANFGALITRLSESGGYFDTDNLISNESSYLHVMGALPRYGVRGGAYIGVGPDQNFSYIARIQPRIAFMVDIRRDNLLQHLMFKALFANARNRAEYLSLWLGKPAPADVVRWDDRSIDDIVTYLDATSATPASASKAHSLVDANVMSMGVTLSADDLATIQRFHQAFMSAGLSLRFTTAGRAPQPYYPTLRQLVLERDLEGKQASYLATEADFRVVKDLQRRNMIIPVVGDLGGDRALPAIGEYMQESGDTLSAFYASNAEDYVMRDGNFARYARSITAIPHDPRSVFIRSFFGGGHPESVNGYYSTQLLQTVDAFIDEWRTYTSYRQLVRGHYLPVRTP